ncbi:MAG: FtsQ-type POTRA domain-containing protein [Puniceicoccales bacterium]|jgi:hypothetical protein|nr:FtsQ-type POTRA domain-containing protein [Puniceicoccales bacterium]
MKSGVTIRGKRTEKRRVAAAKQPTKARKAGGRRRRGGHWVTVVFFAIGCLLALFAVRKVVGFVCERLADGRHLERIEVSTTGSLPRGEVLRLLKIPRDVSLGAIDIGRCRTNLLQCRQVRDAHVERAYPHTLRIKILERTPTFKLFSQKEKAWLFVADDGFVFPCAGLDPQASSIVQLNAAAESGTTLFFVPELWRLMEEASSINGQFVDTWESIAVDEGAYGRNARIEEFEVRCNSILRLRLRASDLARQFAELEYILQDARERRMLPLERVDLSIRGRAYVRPMSRNK